MADPRISARRVSGRCSTPLSGAITSFLFGVQPLDPLTYAGVAAVMAIAAAAAIAAPALRALRVDPAVTFRGE